MKQMTLTAREAVNMLKAIETEPKGFDRKELKLLDRVAEVIESAAADYLRAHEAAEKAVQDGGPDATTVSRIARVDENEGAGLVRLLFENAEFDFVQGRFYGISTFQGSREARKIVLAIEDALGHAETVSPKDVAPTPMRKK
jgi:uncharacterized protein YbjT (DUF2867 family)